MGTHGYARAGVVLLCAGVLSTFEGKMSLRSIATMEKVAPLHERGSPVGLTAFDCWCNYNSNPGVKTDEGEPTATPVPVLSSCVLVF